MDERNRKGFIILLIIPLLILLPIAVIVMSRSTISLSTELRESRLEALCQDVLASGLAWSRQNIEMLSGYEANKEISLDVSNFGMKDCECNITVINVNEKSVDTEVDVRLTRGDRYIKRTKRYTIKLPSGGASGGNTPI